MYSRLRHLRGRLVPRTLRRALPELLNGPAHVLQSLARTLLGPRELPLPADGPSLLEHLQEAAPPGLKRLPRGVTARLRRLTDALLEAEGAGAAEVYDRMVQARQRGLPLPEGDLREALRGKVVLVTGGTGCIGTHLLEELVRLGPAAVVSLSRGVTAPSRPVPGVALLQGDVRDLRTVRGILRTLEPDVIFHLAAQRNPSLAESAVGLTLQTNVLGTRNLLLAAEEAGTPHLVYASTGKALRPFTRDVYAASKKAGEWLVAEAVERGAVRASGARFTHVLDNSIFEERLRGWIRSGSPVRLHGPDVAFFVQSAREAAHLLLAAVLQEGRGTLRLGALRDLGWPVNVLDLALGVMVREGRSAPLYFCGFEPGYEKTPWPGLYDPRTSCRLSPLISALEAPGAAPSPSCPSLDTFQVHGPETRSIREAFSRLERASRGVMVGDARRRAALDEFSWALLEATLPRVPSETLCRLAAWVVQQPPSADPDHRRITHALCRAVAR